MTPMFIPFCVVLLLVAVQQMNCVPCLSKIPSLKVKLNPLPPFKHTGSMPFVMCHVRVYLVRSVSFWLHVMVAAFPDGGIRCEQGVVKTRHAGIEI